MELTPAQSDCVFAARDWFKSGRAYSQPFRMGGLAGTGKSTILPFILGELGVDLTNPMAVAAMAPTGKAAKVMTTKFKEQGLPLRASTVHSAIYMPKGSSIDAIEGQIIATDKKLANARAGGNVEEVKLLRKKVKLLRKDLDKALNNGDAPIFQLRGEDSIVMHAQCVILDEASMVGTEMADDLMQFGVPIIAIGDPGQLPPVGQDQWFGEDELDCFLTEIHRQAADNPIIRLAHAARNGESLDFGDYGDGVRIIRRKEDDVTYNLDRDAKIIVGTNKRRWNVTRKLRRLMGVDDMEGPFEGEPIIVTKNSKNKPWLVNGAEGYATEDHGMLAKGKAAFSAKIEVDDIESTITALQGPLEQHYNGKGGWTASKPAYLNALRSSEQIDFGWAITCHKSQGSQWDDVCVHDESGVFREDAPRWLYTAMTRAAETLTIVK